MLAGGGVWRLRTERNTASRPKRQTRTLFRRKGLSEVMKTWFLSTGRKDQGRFPDTSRFHCARCALLDESFILADLRLLPQCDLRAQVLCRGHGSGAEGADGGVSGGWRKRLLSGYGGFAGQRRAGAMRTASL